MVAAHHPWEPSRRSTHFHLTSSWLYRCHSRVQSSLQWRRHQWTVCVQWQHTMAVLLMAWNNREWKRLGVCYIWAWLSGWLAGESWHTSNQPWDQGLHCGTEVWERPVTLSGHVRVINGCGIYGVWTCLIMRAWSIFRSMFATTCWPKFLIHMAIDFLLNFLIVLH